MHTEHTATQTQSGRGEKKRSLITLLYKWKVCRQQIRVYRNVSQSHTHLKSVNRNSFPWNGSIRYQCSISGTKDYGSKHPVWKILTCVGRLTPALLDRIYWIVAWEEEGEEDGLTTQGRWVDGRSLHWLKKHFAMFWQQLIFSIHQGKMLPSYWSIKWSLPLYLECPPVQ